MNAADKLATVIFWIVMGGCGVVAGIAALYAVWKNVSGGITDGYTWMILAAGVFILLVSALGFRQCIRVLFQKEPPDAA